MQQNMNCSTQKLNSNTYERIIITETAAPAVLVASPATLATAPVTWKMASGTWNIHKKWLLEPEKSINPDLSMVFFSVAEIYLIVLGIFQQIESEPDNGNISDLAKTLENVFTIK